MDFQEYPKCLYRDGKLESEYVVVFSEEEEEASDFLPMGSTEEPKRKPGRPKKA